MFLNIHKQQIERNNQKKRNIAKSGRDYIGDILLGDIGPDQNVLINGIRYERILKEWLRVLYEDEEAAKHPVLIISKNGGLLGDIIEEEGVFFVDTRHKCYDPFLSMESGTVVEIMKGLLKDTGSTEEDNKWSVFEKVMEMLDKYGYETSLFNLKKIYQGYSENGENKVMNSQLFSDILLDAGYPETAALVKSDNSGSKPFTHMQGSINTIANYFKGIASREDHGVSFLDEVIKAKEQGKEMPLFYFAIPDTNRNKILDYLTAELKAVSDYLYEDERPILILDSISLRNKDTIFYKYIFDEPKILLTISAEDCASEFLSEDLEKVLGQYGFYMVIGNSTAAAENLTRIAGRYDHAEVDENKGEGKGYFDVLPENKHKGLGVHINREMLRVRDQDLELSDRELYVCHGRNVWFYSNVVYN